MVTMAMPSTPFGDTQALRRRFSMYTPHTQPDTGAALDETSSQSPRRLSTLTRAMSLRSSSRGSSPHRRSSTPYSAYEGSACEALAPRARSATDASHGHDAAPAAPANAPAPAVPHTLAHPDENAPGPSSQRAGATSPSRSARHNASPLSLRSLSRVPSLVFSSERRTREASTAAPFAAVGEPPAERARASPRVTSPLASDTPTSRRPSFLRRASTPAYDGDVRRNASTPMPRERPESPGLHAYANHRSAHSSGVGTPNPGVVLDDVPRMGSPVDLHEVLQRTPGAAERVAVRVAPVCSTIHMFGPLQVTSHYSLSGTVTLEVPRVREALEVSSLSVHLVGYSMYVDSSARFSSVRLCDVAQELISTPTALPPGGEARFEMEFDLFAPGWLPASFHARSASTFYNLEAVAVFRETRGSASELFASAHASPTTAPESASPRFSGPSETSVSSEARSPPHLIRVCRSRDLVPIPVAQLAVFTGEDVPETNLDVNPFVRSTNPFRAMSRNPFWPAPAPAPAHTHAPASSPTPTPTPTPPAPAATHATHETQRRMTSRVPLRHFSHTPKIPLPVPVVIEGEVYEHLPVRLTLSVPAHTNTHVESEEEQAPLVFGLQVELDPLWAHSKMWSDLRLRELEAMCVQMEKYSSSLSRSYCTAFALPPRPDIGAVQIPMFDPMACASLARNLAGTSAGTYPYNRTLLEARIQQQRAGTAPTDQHNHAERYRSYTVGPQPQGDAKGKKKQREAPAPAPAPPAQPPLAPPSRKKKAFTAPFARLSVFASHKDHDERPPAPSNPESLALPPPNTQENPKASYVFEGHDHFGMPLATKKVRLSFSLPMVPSNGLAASRGGTSQLLPDYESPHVRIRHKLKVKLRFGYGASPLAVNAGTQSLVMCVPVRFTEAPPSEALAQAAPVVFPPRAQRCVPAEGAPNGPVPPALTQATHAAFRAPRRDETPYLPAYVQLFREDGSRLADDSEWLPRYPTRDGAPAHVPPPTNEDAAFAAHLQQHFVLAPDAVRDQKSAAITSVTETWNADEHLFLEDVHAQDPQLRLDDDLLDPDMQQTTVVTGASAQDYDLALEARELHGARSPPPMVASTDA